MKPQRIQRIRNDGTPKEVLDAILVVATYLQANGYAEASIHRTGGASFHIQSRLSLESEYLAEIARLKGWDKKD
jgi:hypothetical protein